MKHRHATNYEAVETLLATRRPDPRFAAADQVAGAAALRLAEVLDKTDNGSSAANLSRELRQVLELLRLTEVDPLPSADDLRDQREADRMTAQFAALTAEMQRPVPWPPPTTTTDDGTDAATDDGDPDDGDDGDQPGPVHAW